MFVSISDVKQANKDNGNHFFSKDTMGFFDSIIYPYIYKGCYFITSEKGPYKKRKFNVKLVNKNGSVNTIGKDGNFSNKDKARKFIQSLPEQFPQAFQLAVKDFNTNGHKNGYKKFVQHVKKTENEKSLQFACNFISNNYEKLGMCFFEHIKKAMNK